MLKADDYEFAQRSPVMEKGFGDAEVIPPPDGDGWIFIGSDNGTAIWARPRGENAETVRQRLLGEACDALAAICFVADRRLDGVNQKDGAELIKRIGDGSPELQELIRSRFEGIEQSQKDAATGG